MMLRLVLAICAVALVLPAAAAAQEGAPCAPWEQTTVGSGLGRLENLAFDGRGGLFVSVSDANAVARVAPDGKAARLAEGLASPGGLAVRWPYLYVNTGNSAQAGISGSTSGTIDRIDLRTGKAATWAKPLTAPNGLVLLADGDAVVSRTFGSGGGLTRVDAADPSKPQPGWAPVDNGNGLALDAEGRWIYVALTLTQESRIVRVDVNDPRRVEEVASLTGSGPPKGLDDLTIDAAGVLYVAANLTGEVLRFDPASGAACVIASGLRQPSSVRIGCGPGWAADRLYVTSFDGTLRALAPPPGATPPAASPSCPPPGSDADVAPPPPPTTPARTCRSRRAFDVHVARRRGRGRVVAVRMTLDGRRLRVRRTRRHFVARVDLRGRARGTVRLRVVARTRAGRTIRDVRTYRPCATTPPR